MALWGRIMCQRRTRHIRTRNKTRTINIVMRRKFGNHWSRRYKSSTINISIKTQTTMHIIRKIIRMRKRSLSKITCRDKMVFPVRRQTLVPLKMRIITKENARTKSELKLMGIVTSLIRKTSTTKHSKKPIIR